MTKADFLDNYWRFYLSIEQRFAETEKYVDFDKTNFKTFSVTYASMIREIGSEVDVTFKELCDIKRDEDAKISKYKEEVMQHYSDILSQKITVAGITLTPFDKWSEKTPTWWKAYNGIKHGRAQNYRKANLENTINSLGALFIIENYLLKKIVAQTGELDNLQKNSSLFQMKDWPTKTINMRDCVMTICGEQNAFTEKE